MTVTATVEGDQGANAVAIALSERLILNTASALAKFSGFDSLTNFQMTDSPSYLRHRGPGVYIITQWDNNVKCFMPRYVGMSGDVSKRLSTYATGTSGNPVDHVLKEAFEGFHRDRYQRYVTGSRGEQQRIRRDLIAEQDFEVMIAHTVDRESADLLETALIRIYGQLDIPLWNSINYLYTMPFPPPRKEIA